MPEEANYGVFIRLLRLQAGILFYIILASGDI